MNTLTEKDAKEDLEVILNLISKQSIIENSRENYTFLENLSFIDVFLIYIKNYKQLGVSILYDFCTKPTARICTCLEIIEAVASSSHIIKDLKVMFLYNVVLNSNWYKIQEAALKNLILCGAREELEELKTLLRNEKLINLINKNTKETCDINGILNFLKRMFK